MVEAHYLFCIQRFYHYDRRIQFHLMDYCSHQPLKCTIRQSYKFQVSGIGCLEKLLGVVYDEHRVFWLSSGKGRRAAAELLGDAVLGPVFFSPR
jgi:hypothetical protein